MQQKELAETLLALMDHGMFDSPLDGRMVSPDIDFVEWMIVVYSAVKGTKTEKDLANWGFIRCPPAVAVQKFLNRKGSSLSVVMGANDYDMNFLVGNDLGNAVYNQWLRHTLSEEQWKRTFDHSQSVNEERAGDAVEVCLATLSCDALSCGIPVLGGSVRELRWIGTLHQVVCRICWLSPRSGIAALASICTIVTGSDSDGKATCRGLG